MLLFEQEWQIIRKVRKAGKRVNAKQNAWRRNLRYACNFGHTGFIVFSD